MINSKSIKSLKQNPLNSINNFFSHGLLLLFNMILHPTVVINRPDLPLLLIHLFILTIYLLSPFPTKISLSRTSSNRTKDFLSCFRHLLKSNILIVYHLEFVYAHLTSTEEILPNFFS